ncbi:predicted protein [Nematostella vectensis]|uniref:Uncharacterized protein n=1 Tax=Nematostella vectensis TaxID=45351 RepID=A7T580_NEMVE|nr:predicted protein [Nematostella vectensis]|eukprot:XP_001620984.1 hypothetical protein NEMVEDRAFT_v1g222488 [Nematostella vectensis]
MAEMWEREEILQTLGKIRLVGGESLVSVPPVFSKDSRNLFCACGRHIHVYSTETGSLQHTLKGHTSQVVGISADTTNELQSLSWLIYFFGCLLVTGAIKLAIMDYQTVRQSLKY